VTLSVLKGPLCSRNRTCSKKPSLSDRYLLDWWCFGWSDATFPTRWFSDCLCWKLL